MSVLTKLYGAVLILLGIIGIFAVPGAWIGAVLIILYGIYLVTPGWKIVIW